MIFENLELLFSSNLWTSFPARFSADGRIYLERNLGRIVSKCSIRDTVLPGIPQLWSGFTLNCLLKALPTVPSSPLVSGVSAWTLCVDVRAGGSDCMH